jgi:hypothetical protein
MTTRENAFSLLTALSSTAVVPLHRAASQTAPTDSTPKITFGAFVDGYFAWDAGRPPALDRSFAGGALFTTQPARHNEFNVNLAFVEAKLEAPHYRGRFALQTGTSVQSNYFGEPAVGSISGPGLGRLIQEAVVGVKVAEGVWVDAGIFYSHMGMESWASRDNPIYTRSLVADYSPYYQSGVKVTWSPSAKLTAQLDVVNGWQNISENNTGKAAGIRLDYAATQGSTISYYNLVSNEAGSRLRVFNGIGARHTSGKLTLVGEFDAGSQSRPSNVGGASTWYGWSAIARVQATPIAAFVGRLEGYTDKDQVIIATGSRTVGANVVANPAFRGTGASIGLDVTPYARVAWRTELRGWRNADAVFPDGTKDTPTKQSGLAVTSLSLSF